MASASVTMPMPPSQWVSARQKSRLWGRASTSGRMVAPVVVKPLITSKQASVTAVKKPGPAAPLRAMNQAANGTAPTSVSRSQLSVTMAKPSRTPWS